MEDNDKTIRKSKNKKDKQRKRLTDFDDEKRQSKAFKNRKKHLSEVELDYECEEDFYFYEN
jgi:hypothetical protein